eukprot:CAMPEP_0178389348 /NCGR_PEP_ID=MMETSP0689_2-20121128/10069_1 /TAXON_ID=160604 /ORGANISM="Amphidinium massartii, Strain CS-259" /LENGTH=496 /DNA_ID=CAMNT_0020009793 /DNA_START=30 /DNA_END=1520 /DNA_ORIENTATION=-
MKNPSQSAQHPETRLRRNERGNQHQRGRLSWRRVDERKRAEEVQANSQGSYRAKDSPTQQRTTDRDSASARVREKPAVSVEVQPSALAAGVATPQVAPPAEVFGGLLEVKGTFLHFQVPAEARASAVRRVKSEPSSFLGRGVDEATEEFSKSLSMGRRTAEGVYPDDQSHIGSRCPTRTTARSSSPSVASACSSHCHRTEAQVAMLEHTEEKQPEDANDLARQAEVLARVKADVASGSGGNYLWKLARQNEDTSRFLQRTVLSVAHRLQQPDEEEAAFRDAEIILHSFRGHVVQAAMHQQANYVLQRIVEVFPLDLVALVATELAGKAVQVAKHRIGCRTMLRMFRHQVTTGPISELAEEIIAESGELCRHVHANYVIQEILRSGHPEYQRRAAEGLRQGKGGLVQTTKSKHGSLCVEVALQHCCENEVQAIAEDLLAHEKAVSLAETSFGGHVLKTLMLSGILSPTHFWDTVSLLPKAKQKRLMKLLHRAAPQER